MSKSIFQQHSFYVTILFGLAVIAYILTTRWPEPPAPRHIQLVFPERIPIDSGTVCHPESLAIILQDIARNEKQQNAALDSIAGSRSQEERLLDRANDRFSDVIGLMEVVLGVAGLLALLVAWQGKRAIDRFNDKLSEIEKAESALKERLTGAEAMLAKIDDYTSKARERADKLAASVPDSPQFSFDEPVSTELMAKLSEYIRRVELLDAFGLPLDAGDFFKLGNAYSALGKYDESVSAYDRGLDLNPNDQDAHYNKGNSLHNLGLYAEAIAAYEAALKIKPGDHQALNNKGNSLAALNRHEEAIAAYNAALAIKPDKYEALNNKGSSLADLNRHKEAIAVFDAALAIKPDKYKAHYNKGNSLGKLNRHDDAIAAYDAALKLKPDDARAMYNKACVFSLLKKKPEMLEWLAKAMAADSKCIKKAQTDPDFAAFRNDPDFKKLVGLQ